MNKKETIAHWKAQINQNSGWALRAALRVFQEQTDSEKMVGGTMESNGLGFNLYDAEKLTQIINHYKHTGSLTFSQQFHLRRVMPKYAAQLYKLVNKEK